MGVEGVGLLRQALRRGVRRESDASCRDSLVSGTVLDNLLQYAYLVLVGRDVACIRVHALNGQRARMMGRVLGPRPTGSDGHI